MGFCTVWMSLSPFLSGINLTVLSYNGAYLALQLHQNLQHQTSNSSWSSAFLCFKSLNGCLLDFKDIS